VLVGLFLILNLAATPLPDSTFTCLANVEVGKIFLRRSSFPISSLIVFRDSLAPPFRFSVLILVGVDGTLPHFVRVSFFPTPLFFWVHLYPAYGYSLPPYFAIFNLGQHPYFFHILHSVDPRVTPLALPFFSFIASCHSNPSFSIFSTVPQQHFSP